ncbi:MAG TPA: hypothetical protein VFX16_12190 [Pseudonocardiaceae bacterium]|nr:hypothetical protein [Pseudonocardiaceae bacterium]
MSTATAGMCSPRRCPLVANGPSGLFRFPTTLALSLLVGGVAEAHTSGHHEQQLRARNDAYRTTAGGTFTVHGNGLLGNDSGSPVTLVAHRSPSSS